MSNYSLLFDVAKARQNELARDVEIARITRNLRRNRKPTSITKKLRSLLTSMT